MRFDCSPGSQSPVAAVFAPQDEKFCDDHSNCTDECGIDHIVETILQHSGNQPAVRTVGQIAGSRFAYFQTSASIATRLNTWDTKIARERDKMMADLDEYASSIVQAALPTYAISDSDIAEFWQQLPSHQYHRDWYLGFIDGVAEVVMPWIGRPHTELS